MPKFLIQTDIPYLYSTWLNSYKRDSLIGKSVRDHIFFDNYRLVLDKIIKESKIYVACHINEPAVIYGYIVFDDDLIHYVYVKESFRRLGIATSLYQKALEYGPISYITHRTYAIDKLNHNLIHNPFLLFETQKEETYEP